MILLKILYGLFFIAIGWAIVKYRKVVKWWTGNIYFIEKYLWRWSTYFVIILVWLGIILYGVFYPFGGIPFLRSTWETPKVILWNP